MGQTTITVTHDAKERLEREKPDDMSWSEFLYGVAEDGEVYGSNHTEIVELAQQVRQLQELVERVPEDTAELVVGEFS